MPWNAVFFSTKMSENYMVEKCVFWSPNVHHVTSSLDPKLSGNGGDFVLVLWDQKTRWSPFWKRRPSLQIVPEIGNINRCRDILIHVDLTSRFAQIFGSCLQLHDPFPDAKTSWETTETANFCSLYFPRGFSRFIFRFWFAIRASIVKRRFFYDN